MSDTLQIIVAVVGAQVILIGWLWTAMRRMEDRTRQDMRENRQDIRELRNEMSLEFRELRNEMSLEIRELRAEIREMSKSITDIQERMAALEAVTDNIRVGLQLPKIGAEKRPPPAE